MKIYKVDREDFSYDEFRGLIILAENEKRARELAIEYAPEEFSEDGVTVEEITMESERVIFEDFNEG